MALESLAPIGQITWTNLDGSYLDIDDDPDSPDGNWADAIEGDGDIVAHVSFPTPTGNPTSGEDLQEFKIWIRKTASGGTNPQCRIDLYENGNPITAGTLTDVTSESGQLKSFYWNAANLNNADGSGVECYIYGDASGGNPANRRSVDVGACEWNCEYSVGVTHFGSATMSGIGSLSGIGLGIFTGKSTLAGLGTLVAIGHKILNGSATLSGVGILSSIAHLIAVGKATLSGSGFLSALGGFIYNASATLSGTGTLSAIGQRIVNGVASLLGVGSLSALGQRIVHGVILLSGYGSLSVSGVKVLCGKAILAGSGLLAAIGNLVSGIISTRLYFTDIDDPLQFMNTDDGLKFTNITDSLSFTNSVDFLGFTNIEDTITFTEV